MGLSGVLEIEKFVEPRRAVTLGAASFFPAEFGLARRVTRPPSPSSTRRSDRGSRDYAAVASHLLRIRVEARARPVRRRAAAVDSGLEADRDRQTLMRFRGTEAAVLSGLMKGAPKRGTAPRLRKCSPAGPRRDVRDEPLLPLRDAGEFNMLFNAVLHYNDSKR